jgi:anti-anti-sigma regulatory factor
MLKISQIQMSNRCVTLQVEGRIVGPWVAEARATFEKILSDGHKMELDLEQVAFVDPDGVALINRMFSRGVTLIRCSLFVEEQLKVAAKTAGDTGPGSTDSRINGSDF